MKHYLVLFSSWWLVSAFFLYMPQLGQITSSSYWVSYVKSESLHDNKISNFWVTQLKTSSVVIMLVPAIFTLASANADAFLSTVWSNKPLITAGAYSALMAGVALFYTLKGSNSSANNVEVSSAILFTWVAGCAIITAANLLTAFFGLELLGSATLYAFFVFGSYNANSARQTSLDAFNASVYQFLINFLSSWGLYVCIVALAYIHGGSTFVAAPARLAEGTGALVQGLAIFSMFVKMATGPWIFYKLNVYKGMTLQMALLYTVVYMGGVLVALGGFMSDYGMICSPLVVQCLPLVVGSAALFFGANVYQAGSVLLFLSFSSLLNTSFFVLQLL